LPVFYPDATIQGLQEDDMADLKEAQVPDIGTGDAIPVIEILVKVGDAVKKDQGLVTLESDKATMEVPAPFDGVVKELKVKIGDEIGQGHVVALLESSSTVTPSTPTATAASPAPAAPASKPAPASSPTVSPVTPAPISASNNNAVKTPPVSFEAEGLLPGNVPYASPAVRVFARELGVDLSQIKGSERGGRISKEDVQQFVKTALSGGARAASGGSGLNLLPWPQVDFAKFGSVTSLPLSRIQKISGANLSRNWVMIPHVTQHDEADITEMEAFRKKIGEENPDQKLTPLVFLIKASVAALRAFPNFNASLDANGEHLTLKNYFHIGIAVDTPNGLVVPVIRDCDKKSLLELAKELGEISKKARDGKLGPTDMQGGCFSISSLGGIGGTNFTPIINAPEVAILGVSKSQTKPIWNGAAFDPRLMLPLSLSYDHRVIDGAAAARFTSYLAKMLGDIRRLLV
jgi:pyruvate dehydrogenase E2 component (dihydrolipoamide acetyltransferase)